MYWPGIRNRDGFRIFNSSGSPTVTNRSMMDRIHLSFGRRDDGGQYLQPLANANGPYVGTTGDVNGDGLINVADARLIAQYSVGLIPSLFDSKVADVDCDKTIDIVDALRVIQHDAKLSKQFPPCTP